MAEVVVWQCGIDDWAWKCRVIREGDHGRLKVERASDGKVVLDQEVSLSYGALFGPDVDDVELWEEMAINAIDDAEEGV